MRGSLLRDIVRLADGAPERPARHRSARGPEDASFDMELLTLVLARAVPARRAARLTHELWSRFGSFAEVVSAPPHLVREVSGVDDVVIAQLEIVRRAALKLAQGKLLHREVFSQWSTVIEYCTARMAFLAHEECRLLFLDRRNRLIADELHQKGTVDHIPVYPREVIKRALELSASGMILVHNHPSGDPTPSQADIAMTQRILEAAEKLGIRVHDHIIIAPNSYASFRTLGFL